jgi:hypothetical protein
MGSDNLHHKAKQTKLTRREKRKKVLPYILIVCEGEKTEPNYFEWYRKNCKQAINVEIFGEGKNTESLVKETIRIKRKIQKRDNMLFDQVWCVFDKDSFSSEIYNNAFQLCDNENIEAAYSNECFEIWYLLHFHYYNCGMEREVARVKLDEIMQQEYGKRYEKNMKDTYELLKDKQEVAICFAKKLESYCRHDEELHHQNPSTSVYRLVEELNKYRKVQN